MSKIHIDVEGVTFGGEDVKIGTVVEVSEMGFKALVSEGKGRPVDENDQPVDLAEASAELPSDDEVAAKAAGNLELTKKALADQYNLEEGGVNGKPGLKEAALAAGVDFPFDAKKGDLIDLIVAQGKAAELIK
jgi:hypothetical protein